MVTLGQSYFDAKIHTENNKICTDIIIIKVVFVLQSLWKCAFYLKFRMFYYIFKMTKKKERAEKSEQKMTKPRSIWKACDDRQRAVNFL